MANVLSEPFLENVASMSSQVHVERTKQPVSQLALDAKAAAEADPYDPELWIKYGRALRRQSMHREAIDAYAMGISYNPFYPLLYRHKAHAYINTGRYAEAAADFEFALRLDPTNVDCWYHLALSYFLLEDYQRAEATYKKCYTMSDEDLDVISCTDWLWMTLRRLGKKEEAEKLLERITPDMEPGMVVSYHRRLLMYKGLIKPEELMTDAPNDLEVVTMGFGLANYYYELGQEEKGNAMILRVLEAGKEDAWSAFGYQAALVEKKRRNL